MKLKRIFLVCGLGLCLFSNPVLGDDLDLIPDSILDLEIPEAKISDEDDDELDSKFQFNGELEFELGLDGRSRTHVPLPKYSSPRNRPYLLQLKTRIEGKINKKSFYYYQGKWSGQFNEYDSLNEFNGNFDHKEFYLSNKINENIYLDLGRMNIREGVGSGFNPTDYFKKGSVSLRTSDDPGKLREDRLGVLGARIQWLDDVGSVSLAFLPKINSKNRNILTNGGDFSLNLNSTNNSDKIYLKIAPKLFKEDNPEVIYFKDKGQTSIGFNYVKGIGEKLVFSFELSGNKSAGLTDILGPLMPANLNLSKKLRTQSSFGFNFSDDKKRSIWVEWQNNQSGFSSKQWQNYWNLGDASALLKQNPVTQAIGEVMGNQFWGIRQINGNLGEPIGRNMVFVRNSWDDALGDKKNLSAIWLFNPHDGSFFLQPRLDGKINDFRAWHVSLTTFVGKSRSEFGSIPSKISVRYGHNWYF